MLASTKLIINYRDIWPQGAITVLRCILSEDHHTGNPNCRITRFIKHKYVVPPPIVGTAKYIAQPTSTLSEVLVQMNNMNLTPNGYKIYTDGGWNNQTGTLYELLYGKDITKFQATGAVCIVKEDESTYESKEIITIHLTNHKKIPLTSAYPTELLSMILALHLAKAIKPIEICTDSDSVKQVMEKKEKIEERIIKRL